MKLDANEERSLNIPEASIPVAFEGVYTKAGTYIHWWARHIQLRGGTLSECAVREQRGGTYYFGNVPGLAPTILGKDTCPFFANLS
jgi:hypothetical protein